MFEVGKEYYITTNDGEGESGFSAKVLRWEPPLLVIDYAHRETILNTSSLGFVSAYRDDDETRRAVDEAREKSHNEFLDSLVIKKPD